MLSTSLEMQAKEKTEQAPLQAASQVSIFKRSFNIDDAINPRAPQIRQVQVYPAKSRFKPRKRTIAVVVCSLCCCFLIPAVVLAVAASYWTAIVGHVGSIRVLSNLCQFSVEVEARGPVTNPSFASPTIYIRNTEFRLNADTYAELTAPFPKVTIPPGTSDLVSSSRLLVTSTRLLGNLLAKYMGTNVMSVSADVSLAGIFLTSVQQDILLGVERSGSNIAYSPSSEGSGTSLDVQLTRLQVLNNTNKVTTYCLIASD